MRRSTFALLAAAALLVAVAAGLLIWEWPRERSPRFVALELEAADQLPGAGLLMAAAGVTLWNGSTLRIPARVLYVLPNERAAADSAGALRGSVQVHLPEGAGALEDADLLACMDARAVYRVDSEGFLESLAIAGVDGVTGRVFSLRTVAVRQARAARVLTLELETSAAEAGP